jgi:hypothetical protein
MLPKLRQISRKAAPNFFSEFCFDGHIFGLIGDTTWGRDDEATEIGVSSERYLLEIVEVVMR